MANKVITDGEIDKAAADTGKALAEQPKVKVKLHLPAEEKRRLEAAVEQGAKADWPAETVIVNGYTYVIQRGKDVEVPQTVAEILEHAGMI